MDRYAFLYRGEGSPLAEADAIAATRGVRVVDHELARAMLVEAEPATIEHLRQRFPQWTISPEVYFPLPKAE